MAVHDCNVLQVVAYVERTFVKTLDYYFLIVTKMGFRLRLNAGQARS